MSSIKKYLKSAKTAIESNDPENALEYISEVLDIDDKNYFAYIFQGKSYQLLDKNQDAVGSFEKAVSIEPDNLLGWKGYFQLARSMDNYELLFKVLTGFLEKLVEQEVGTAEAIKDFKNYLDSHNYKGDLELYEYYLKSVIPGTRLGDLIGTQLGLPENNLKALIDTVKRKQQSTINNIISKEKMKLPRVLTQENRNHLNSISWSIYKDSKLEEYYTNFLNICMDDEVRKQYEEELLKYKYDLLKVAPDKNDMFKQTKEMVDGMVLVNTKSIFCWELYLDWTDVKEINEFEFDRLIFFIKNFRKTGLGKVLYGYLMSDLSPFSKEQIEQILKELNGDKLKKKDDLDIQVDQHDAEVLKQITEDDTKETSLTLSSEEILSLMLQGFTTCSKSILANRLICSYYIHLGDYEEGSENCRKAIHFLADIQRSLGIDLKNSKEDLLCSLAIIYTHFEAPKNFSRALQLYDKILETNPNNIKSKIGKALILIQENDLQTARTILNDLVTKYPSNTEALVEFYWCEIRLKDYAVGRNGLLKTLENIQGMDLKTCETRAIVNWRIAKGYMLENENSSEFVNKAYEHLIKSLKESKNYAPTYTLLGLLYQDAYNDLDRAQKCYYKAFELDVAEIMAAKRLVEDLTLKNEWEVAEILCNRIVSSERARRFLLNINNEDPDKSWPYRVLGCSSLNKQDDTKAVEWFQTALRMTKMDIECWIGLGEAYFNCGRLDASAKVFRHALDMNPELWETKYMLGLVTCSMGEFDEGISYLVEASKVNPEEECLMNALYESYISNAEVLIKGGFIGRAIEKNIMALDLISRSAKGNRSSQKLWKSLHECLKLFLMIQERIEKFPINIISDIFDNSTSESIVEVLKIENLSKLQVSLDLAVTYFETEEYVKSVSMIMILAAIAAIGNLPVKVGRSLRSTVYFNLGLSLVDYYHHTHDESFRQSSIKILKKAIQLESNKASYWIALGNVYVPSNPQIAQHCFIKAISLEPNEADHWTNLAALYLRYGDVDLAQEAFLRAQSVAPQKVHSWIGYALATQALGETERASNLFTHAYILSNGRNPLAQLLYGLAIVDKRIGTGSDPQDIEAAQEISVANFAIMNYLKFEPNDEVGLKVSLLISERCQNYELSIQLGSRLCSILEKRYESTESDLVLVDYARAKAQLARIYLAQHDYKNAIETAQFAIEILGDNTDGNAAYAPIILSGHVVLGLTYFFDNDFDASLEQFQYILEEYNNSAELITLTAQVLQAYGSEETKQAALDQLFAFIETNGSSLIVVLTIGAISIVDNLEEYLGAVKEELKGLQLVELMADSFRSVPKLLHEINERLNENENDKIWQRNAMLFPSDYSVWKQLNTQMALSVASLSETKLTSSAYSQALCATGTLREVQRSIFLLPCNSEACEALKGCW